MSPGIDLLDGNRHGLRVTLMAPMVLNARNGEAGSAGENGRPASRATRCGRVAKRLVVTQPKAVNSSLALITM
jgi:hypothetical protein